MCFKKTISESINLTISQSVSGSNCKNFQRFCAMKPPKTSRFLQVFNATDRAGLIDDSYNLAR